MSHDETSRTTDSRQREGSEHFEPLIRRFAGVFILASLALGWWGDPRWLLFTAFVGVNLLQSSFTGFCPLEMMLRMRRRGRGASATEQILH